MPQNFTKRDKEVTWAIHRLMIASFLADTKTFIIWALTRPLAMFIYHVGVPFFVAYGLQAILAKDMAGVTHYVWLLLAATLIYAVLWSIGGVAISRNGITSIPYVERKAFINFLGKDYEFLNNTLLGSLSSQATRLMDANSEYAQLMLLSGIKELIVVTASVVIIALQSPQLAIITVGFVLLLLSYTIIVSRLRVHFRRDVSAAASVTAGVVSDALGNATTVKSFAAESHELKRLDRALSSHMQLLYRQWLSSIPADIGRMFLSVLVTAILLVVTGRMYSNGTISVAIVILVQLYVIKLVMSTQEIAGLVTRYESIMGSVHQTLITMQLPSSVQDSPDAVTLSKKIVPNIAFKNVSFRYPDAAQKSFAVRNLSLNIKPGEKVGLVGKSGSGKSTITKLLLRFMDVTNGQIEVGEQEIQRITQHSLRSQIAYAPQEPLLFHRSIAENIAYSRPSASGKVIEEAERIAYVHEFTKEFPKGYNTLVGEKGVKLSGGQRQRVAIARALIKQAPILILDEATSSLDSESEQYIQKALLNLMKDRTTLVIAHRLSTIKHMDRIIVVDKGRVIQEGTHDDLIKDTKGVYAKLWNHQTGGYLATEA